jgi:hypothetical protein
MASSKVVFDDFEGSPDFPATYVIRGGCSIPLLVCCYSPYHFNLGAHIGAMGAAINLLIEGPAAFYCVLLTVLSLLLQIWILYQEYAAVLK